MMKKIAWTLFLLLACVVPSSAARDDEYRIVRKDGSWLSAADKPELFDEMAMVRLPNGLMALEERREIDWRTTEAWNFRATFIRGVISPLEDVLPLTGNDPFAGTLPPAPEEGVDVSSAEAAASALASQPEPAPDPVVQMRVRIRLLGERIEALKARKSAAEEELANARSLKRSIELQRQVDSLENEIRTVRSEQAGLILRLPRRESP